MRRRILTDVIPLTKVGVGQVVTYAHWGNEEEDTYICPSSETLILSPLCPTAERRRILTYVSGNEEEDIYRCHSTEINSQKSWPQYTYHILSVSQRS